MTIKIGMILEIPLKQNKTLYEKLSSLDPCLWMFVVAPFL